MGDRWSDVVEDLARYGRVIGQRRRASRDGGGTDWKHSELRARDRALVAALHPPRMRLEVKQVIRETPSAVTLRMRRLDGPLPPFRPGQYVNLFVTVDGVATSRPYSISSRPGLDHLDLTVRERPGGFVSPYLVRRLRAGAVLASTGPKGHFHHEPLTDGDDLVFLAGGSGVTPFVSWLRDAVERGWPQRITLLYGTRVPTDVLFGRELKALARGNPRFTLVVVVSEPPRGFRGVRGFLDAARIRDAVGDVAGKTFYLCGPGAMYDFCRPQLEELGVPEYKAKQELYGPPEDVTKVAGWPRGLTRVNRFKVRVADVTFEASAVEPLLDSMERAGITWPGVCRSGECSACRAKLVSGTVFVPPNTGVRESDMRDGRIHPCVSYPTSDLVLRP